MPQRVIGKFIRFLKGVPGLSNEHDWRALLLDASLKELIDQTRFDMAQADFAALLVDHLDKFVTLPDGRPALVALLEAASQHVVREKQQECQQLMDEL